MELTQEDYDAAIKAAVDEATTGLVNKNNELIGERRTDGEKLTLAQQSLEASNKAASQAAKEKLASENKWTELGELHAREKAEAVAISDANAEKYKGLLDSTHSERAINEVLEGVDPRFKTFVKTQLASSTKISYNEQGQAVTTIKDGDKEYLSASDFLAGVKDSETWKSVLKGVESSGANTMQSNGVSSKKMTLTEQAIHANKGSNY